VVAAARGAERGAEVCTLDRPYGAGVSRAGAGSASHVWLCYRAPCGGHRETHAEFSSRRPGAGGNDAAAEASWAEVAQFRRRPSKRVFRAKVRARRRARHDRNPAFEAQSPFCFFPTVFSAVIDNGGEL